MAHNTRITLYDRSGNLIESRVLPNHVAAEVAARFVWAQGRRHKDGGGDRRDPYRIRFRPSNAKADEFHPSEDPTAGEV